MGQTCNTSLSPYHDPMKRVASPFSVEWEMEVNSKVTPLPMTESVLEPRLLRLFATMSPFYTLGLGNMVVFSAALSGRIAVRC